MHSRDKKDNVVSFLSFGSLLLPLERSFNLRVPNTSNVILVNEFNVITSYTPEGNGVLLAQQVYISLKIIQTSGLVLNRAIQLLGSIGTL